jgi:hypothetical protein
MEGLDILGLNTIPLCVVAPRDADTMWRSEHFPNRVVIYEDL